MVTRPSGVLNRHRGFQNIGQPNPVFTVENSEDNNPIRATHSTTARPAELHNVKPAQSDRSKQGNLYFSHIIPGFPTSSLMTVL